MCHKNKNTKGGCSNIQHGKHDKKVNNNTNTNNADKRKDNPTSHMHTNSTNNTWVRNISGTPLTEVQVKVLNYGQNYALVPRNPPIIEYVASIEQVCTTLKQGETEELREKVKAIIMKIQCPKYNITREKHKALEDPKKDNNMIILTADKGVSIVVMDKEEYIKKLKSY